MRQTPPAPAAAPVAPAIAGAPAQVALPTGEIIGIPSTAQEVRGLRERREILRQNLERAGNRRSELVREMDGSNGERVPSAEARVGVQQRLAIVDEQILQMERDRAATERLISNAPPQLLATMAENPRPQGSQVDEDEAILVSFMAFGAGVVITYLIGKFRRRRYNKKNPTGAKADVGTTDPRIERLTQTVDAMAEELERIGEGQRFVTQILSKRQEAPALSLEAERR